MSKSKSIKSNVIYEDGFFMGEMGVLDAVLVDIIVGIVLIYFAIKLLIKKDKEENGELK